MSGRAHAAAAAAASLVGWVLAVWAAASGEGVYRGGCAGCPSKGLFSCGGDGGCTDTSCRHLNNVARTAQAFAVLSLLSMPLLVFALAAAGVGRLQLGDAAQACAAAHCSVAAMLLVACACSAALWDAEFCGSPAAKDVAGRRLGPSPFLFIAAAVLQTAAAAAALLQAGTTATALPSDSDAGAAAGAVGTPVLPPPKDAAASEPLWLPPPRRASSIRPLPAPPPAPPLPAPPLPAPPLPAPPLPAPPPAAPAGRARCAAAPHISPPRPRPSPSPRTHRHSAPCGRPVLL
eukprot:TRINITY_DN7603_c0_g1_i1.p2 TRINITY_DN7603_c0_g1~~TRINITY_DN7603_c0_g1_i1.p2  ORF type:complete len:290 (+),score=59.34 TRINITY_DN7603_c0_g1_i1:40-909(+)